MARNFEGREYDSYEGGGKGIIDVAYDTVEETVAAVEPLEQLMRRNWNGQVHTKIRKFISNDFSAAGYLLALTRDYILKRKEFT